LKQYKLINLPEQFIIVTDDIIKEDELFLMGTELIYNSSLMTDEWCKSKQPKVIAEQSQIDFNGFEDIVGYVDVEKLALLSNTKQISDEFNLLYNLGFIKGFAKAQELLSSKQFTLKDIEKAIHFGELYQKESMLKLFTKKGTTPTEACKTFIQSLQPKKEWLVEIEMELNTDGKNGLDRASFIPKLIDNKVRIIKIIA